MATTFFLSILWDLEVGIVVSIIISLLLVVRRSARPRMTILGRVRNAGRGGAAAEDAWEPINENPDAAEDVPGVLIVRIRENLDFANTAQLKGVKCVT
jgi:MFS superfamily sulfate permease-like transporter